jgi:hypothetical protein
LPTACPGSKAQADRAALSPGAKGLAEGGSPWVGPPSVLGTPAAIPKLPAARGPASPAACGSPVDWNRSATAPGARSPPTPDPQGTLPGGGDGYPETVIRCLPDPGSSGPAAEAGRSGRLIPWRRVCPWPLHRDRPHSGFRDSTIPSCHPLPPRAAPMPGGPKGLRSAGLGPGAQLGLLPPRAARGSWKTGSADPGGGSSAGRLRTYQVCWPLERRLEPSKARAGPWTGQRPAGACGRALRGQTPGRTRTSTRTGGVPGDPGSDSPWREGRQAGGFGSCSGPGFRLGLGSVLLTEHRPIDGRSVHDRLPNQAAPPVSPPAPRSTEGPAVLVQANATTGPPCDTASPAHDAANEAEVRKGNQPVGTTRSLHESGKPPDLGSAIPPATTGDPASKRPATPTPASHGPSHRLEMSQSQIPPKPPPPPRSP